MSTGNAQSRSFLKLKIGELSGRDFDASRGMGLLRQLLSLAVFLHALGLFVLVFRMHDTNFGSFLFMVLEFEDASAVAIEKATVTAFLLLSGLNLFYKNPNILIALFLYIFFEAWAGYFQGGYHFSNLSLATYALRYLTPVALLAFVAGKSLTLAKRQLQASRILQLGIALVFASHGVECLLGNPKFIDLLLGGSWNLLGLQMSQDTALQLMQLIGVVDLAVALAVLIRPLRLLLFWASFWGLLTALSRMFALGTGAYPEVLLRASHFLGPFSLYLLLFQPAWAREFSPKGLVRRTVAFFKWKPKFHTENP